MLPATLALGMALPLVMEMAGPREDESAGPLVGRLLAVNTVGAIAGPLLATFLMGPRLGLWWSLVVLGGFLVVAGAFAGLTRAEAAIARAPRRRRGCCSTRRACRRFGSGRPTGQRLVSVREGTYGTTAVIADDHDRWITVNNSYVLGGTAAGDEERWQAHLPLLLHPSPRRVAFVGMGTGITAGAALLHPVERIVALEIVPEVALAAREDFADVNARVLEDPRVSVVIDDGRHYLASSPQAFDVVVGDLLVPWRPAEAPLYTQEHFESVRRALTAEGVFCQWLPLYQLSPEQLAIILRTFLDVFPQHEPLARQLHPGRADPGPGRPSRLPPAGAEAIDARVQALAASTESNPFLQHPAGLWLFLVGPLHAEMPWFSGARRNRDGEPWIELLSPRSHARGDQALLGPGPVTPFLEQVAAGPLAGTSAARPRPGASSMESDRRGPLTRLRDPGGRRGAARPRDPAHAAGGASAFAGRRPVVGATSRTGQGSKPLPKMKSVAQSSAPLAPSFAEKYSKPFTGVRLVGLRGGRRGRCPVRGRFRPRARRCARAPGRSLRRRP